MNNLLNKYISKYIAGKNIIIISIFIVGLVIGGGGFYLFQNQKLLSPQSAGDKAIAFINEAIKEQGATASLISVAEENGVYKIHLKIGEKEYDSYVTKDGRLLFSSAYDLTNQTENNSQTQNSSQSVSKRDVPDVKLFVMSYCPYGLQAEKMFLPVYNLFKDKADMGIYFVSYIMHGKKEIDENLRQYCIENGQEDKYDEYLSCFVKEDNSEKCLTEAAINKTSLQSCVAATDQEYNISAQYEDQSTWLNGQYPKFDINSDLNQKYGVQGSPTLVINDQIVDLDSRSPESLKTSLCQAFNSSPAECSQTLSSEAYSAGFGSGQDSSGGSGSCQ